MTVFCRSHARRPFCVWQFVRPSIALFLFASLSFVFLPGCRSGADKKYDLLEAELRTRERELAEAQAELNSCRAIQQMMPVARSSGASVHPAAASSMCRDITLGLGTGGYDADGKPGDEGLQIILVPKDTDGSAIKVPGYLTIVAYDLARDGTKTPVGLWELTPDRLRSYWQAGLLSSGYKLSLQWHRPPVSEKVRVIARLTTLDGKPFETDKDVSVKPMPAGSGSIGAMPELPPPSGLVPPADCPATPYDPFPANGSGVRLKPARGG
ncbi:MAG: hypothetical protein U0798_17965 [Gemmataceae bacterium]